MVLRSSIVTSRLRTFATRWPFEKTKGQTNRWHNQEGGAEGGKQTTKSKIGLGVVKGVL